jgi:hypothetical protein
MKLYKQVPPILWRLSACCTSCSVTFEDFFWRSNGGAEKHRLEASEAGGMQSKLWRES